MAPWVFETNSGFRVKSRGIGLVCGFEGFSASIGRAFILAGGGWALGYHPMGFRFEINLIFLIKSFFCMHKKSKQKHKYLENEKSF